MNIRRLLPALLLFLPAAIFAQDALETIRKEWPDFRYLEPKQVRELPPAVRADLEKRGCKVPKFTKWDARHNAIQGQFLKAGQQDWAVLCRHEDKTAIVLYPGGASAEMQTLKSENNDPYRIIHTATAFVLGKRAIRDKQTESMPTFDHDAIEDGPIQKTAVVVYYRDGEWTEF